MNDPRCVCRGECGKEAHSWPAPMSSDYPRCTRVHGNYDDTDNKRSRIDREGRCQICRLTPHGITRWMQGCECAICVSAADKRMPARRLREKKKREAAK